MNKPDYPAFTPGPWESEYDPDNQAHEILMGTARKRSGVSQVQHTIRYEHGLYADEDAAPQRAQFTEADANARLIAAAPDMYEALRMLLGTYRAGLHKSYTLAEAKAAARAALAKADA